MMARACGALFALLAAVSLVGAGEVEVFSPNSHQMTGEVIPGEEHFVPLDLPAGTSLAFQFRPDKKADKQNSLLAEAELVGPDGSTVDIPSDLIKDKKGFDVKKLIIAVTGRHMLILRGRDGTGGFYSFKLKAKYPKTLSGEFDGAGVDLEIPFPASNGALVTASVKGPKGGAVPTLPKVRRPDASEFGPPGAKSSKTGFSFKKFEQKGTFGTHVLLFGVTPESAGGDRTFKYKIKLKFPKVPKAKLVYDDLVVAPLVTSITPEILPVSTESVPMQVIGRFFQPNAQVILTKGGQTDWKPEGQVATPTGITAALRSLSRLPGFWDVKAINPSGGNFVKLGGLLVLPPTPEVLSVDPGSSFDNVTDTTLMMIGTQLSSETKVEFTMALPGGGVETLTPSEIVDESGGGIRVTISPFRRPLGFYDVTVQNPGPVGVPDSDTTTKQNVFEILNAAPAITASTPARNLAGGPFTMTIDGSELEAGATVSLQRTGETDVAGTNVVVNPAGTQITCTFNMDGQAQGRWDLLAVNPDLQQDSLTDAFAITGSPTATFNDPALGVPDVSLALEHDVGLVVWIETDEDATGNGTTWKVMGRLFDTFLYDWKGTEFSISSTSDVDDTMRFVTTAYNPAVDEWLVVWTEQTFVSTVNERSQAGLTPLSGTVFQVAGRRIDTDGTRLGSEIDLSTSDPCSINAATTYDMFEYTVPHVLHAPWNDAWYVIMTHEWDDVPTVDRTTTANGGINPADYDVYVFQLNKDDPKFVDGQDVCLHSAYNREGECTLIMDTDREKFLAPGSCVPTTISGEALRELQGRFVTGSLGISPGASGTEAVTLAAAGATTSVTNGRGAYNSKAGEFLVVYEKVAEGTTDKMEIRAVRVGSASESVIGNELTIATNSSHDLVLPRAVYNEVTDEYLVTWTVDDPAGTPKAEAQRLKGTDASKDGAAFSLGKTGSGYPVVAVDDTLGTYTAIVLNGWDDVGSERNGTGIEILLFE